MFQNLKSCPFCGCDNPVLWGTDGENYYIECPICGVSTKKFDDYDKIDDFENGYDAIALAIKAWNLRKDNAT